jgi:hypothetical protein
MRKRLLDPLVVTEALAHILPHSPVTLWPQLVKARNVTTHSKDQWQIPAEYGLEEVEGFVKRIDRLFSPK